MKKLLSFCLVISIIFSMLPMTTLAVETENQSIHEMNTVQREIDAILAELNDMAAEEKMVEILAEENREMREQASALKAQNERIKQNLENRLEQLGVNTIDPDNPDDMAAIKEIMLDDGGASARTIPDPPNLEALAECYTLRQHNGRVTIDGTTYRYSYIYVTDDKGYSRSQLTQSSDYKTLIGQKSTILSDILDYQFSFGLSAYLGTIPYGWIADWTIGTVFSVFDSLNENSPITNNGNSDIYSMLMLSVTQMMYVYVYLPTSDSWELCGTSAPNISFARTESMVANVEGRAVSDSKDYTTVRSKTGGYASTYVQTYINDWYHDIDYIGSFTVNTYDGGTVRFVPGFVPFPGLLI